MAHFLAPTNALAQWVTDLFLAAGSSQTEATQATEHLVGANLAGHDSHGIGMIPRYVDSSLHDELQLNQQIAVAVDTGSMIIADGQRGLGQAVAHQAMELAIERTKEHGVTLLGLRNAHHIGRVGHWAEMALERGLGSIMFTNAMSGHFLVAPHGGKQPKFLTNPFTVGIPRRDGDPLVLDFATSAIAQGKARVAYNSKKPLPTGSAIDADGEPSTDAAVMFEEPVGALTTFAGHKGYALALVCEILGAAMTGGPTIRPETQPPVHAVYNNMMAILFDPQKLGTQDHFESETSAFLKWVQSAEPNSIGKEMGGILIPGDPERRSRLARAEQIPVDEGTMAEIDAAEQKIASKNGQGPGPLSKLCSRG